MRLLTNLFALALLAVPVYSQNYPLVVKDFAGSFPLGDNGPATSALLYFPSATVPDPAGNLFILDAGNFRVRRMTPDGRITTFAEIDLFAYDMKRGSDGSLYVSGIGQVLRISSSGVVSVLAGTGDYGFAGDNGPAITAQVGDAYGVAVDAAGSVFFTDVSSGGHRVRQVTTDGRIRTVAGGATRGFSGDRGPAASAAFNYPSGVAIDSTGAIYVADYSNSRVRRFTVGGDITTFAGNGRYALPVDGPATASGMGTPNGIAIDPRDNLIIADPTAYCVMRVSPTGALSVVAGNFEAYSPIEDGGALAVALRGPQYASGDAAGNVYVADGTHRVRRIADNRATTIAGRLHFAGDNGPATAAIMNDPADIAFDLQGNAYIVDSANYLIRRVTPAAVITTYAGKQNPGVPTNGSSITNAPLPFISAIASDARGALYLAANFQVYKVADGVLTIVAGTGAQGNAGDGGRAAAATFGGIVGMTVDPAGNIYIADSNRIRVVNAETGVISAFAGSGARGRGGDGALATGAQFDFSSRAPMAVDRTGNLYVADGNNFSVRMINRQGVISTAIGNGSFGHFDGAPATSAFSVPGPIAFDSANNLYVASRTYAEIYRLSGGVLRRISGAGDNEPVDGAAALTSRFSTTAMKFDANDDLYSVDLASATVRRLVMNSPTGLVIADGNNQTAQTGQPLPKLLKVQLNGRAGVGVSGITINFAVKSGDARLSAATAQTDSTGAAGISLTLGSTAGQVVVTATAAGTNLAPVEFAATATGGGTPGCTTLPAVTSARSAGDFGGSSTFASGSWLEIKGSNLSATTRSWAGADFNGVNAPTSLDGVSVTINGRRAFIGYISPTQINVQAPADASTGALDLTVASGACTSASFRVQKAAVAGGLLAPSVFNVGGTQYLAALYQDGFTFVGREGLIAGVPFREAAAGDAITLYGIGFGDTVPVIAPGTIVSASNSVPGLTISFGSTEAVVTYAGLAPNAVGLYQFNVTVPRVTAGDHRISVRVNGVEMPQVGYLTVR